MAYTEERLEEIVQELTGTCQSLEDVLDDNAGEDVSDIQLCEYIDNEIFQCEECGWWCEICEGNENQDGGDVCDDCHASHDYAEEE